MMSDMRDADPGLLTRMRAAMQGERDAAPLAAVRRANSAVYLELAHAERQFDALLVDGRAVWRPDIADASHQLATWVGFVLQTTGEHLIDTDYAASPSTVGYLPVPTFTLAWHCLGAAQRWLLRAQQARVVDGYDVRREHALPVLLPAGFTTVRHLPTHLPAMLDAGREIRLRAEYGLFAIEQAERPERIAWLRRLLAKAAATHDYVERLPGAHHDPILLRYCTKQLSWTLNTWLLVGQLVAVPDVIDRFLTRPAQVSAVPRTLPIAPPRPPAIRSPMPQTTRSARPTRALPGTIAAYQRIP
jgi:hypothetical protein